MWADARDSCLPHVSVAATEEAAGITYYRLRVRQHADARTEWQVLCVFGRVCMCVCTDSTLAGIKDSYTSSIRLHTLVA